ncbi:lipoprotein N-acyltransferase Lnb domain-containing protein [Croceiramulus getboli]|nr:DUF4105 domain-containing protein [Flavobacteriaceae bacterium YJPT1-3]
MTRNNYLLCFLLFAFSLLFQASTYASADSTLQLSSDAKASILTMGPGSSLVDAFGHSAIRIEDTRRGIDVVYNYGVYDFDTPNFYLKFARGKLPYLLGVNRFEDFVRNYKAQNRWIKEQVLALNSQEVNDLFQFLQVNARPENRAYAYDFFYDNCATKIGEVLYKVAGDQIQWNLEEQEADKTFRALIYENSYWNTWGRVGMDIALGSVADRTTTPLEELFLPDYVFNAFAKADLQTPQGVQPLVQETTTLNEGPDKAPRGFWLTSPFLVFLLISLLIGYLTWKDNQQDTRNRTLDTCLFVFTGLIGLGVVLLWFATDHMATQLNYTLLWAFVLNLFMAPVAAKKEPFVQFIAYLKFLLILLALMVFHWVVGVQQFALALLPFYIALAIRYFYLLRYFRRHPLTAPERK